MESLPSLNKKRQGANRLLHPREVPMNRPIKPQELVQQIVNRDIGRRDFNRILAGTGLVGVAMPLLSR
ncbi:MAG: hypothetical protein WD715_15790, partial [Dongiaceae bacterium]